MTSSKYLHLQLLILIALIFITACNPKDSYEAEPNPDLCSSCKIESPTTWTDKYDDPEKPDYIIEGSLILFSDLTLKPGVVIAFKENGLMKVYCEGSLSAVGTENKRITFKGEEPIEGFWKGIEIRSPDQKNQLDYCDILHTGKPNSNSGEATAIRVKRYLGGIFGNGACSSHVRITNCTIKEASGYGISVGEVAYLDSFYNNTITVNGKAAVLTNFINLNYLDTSSVFEANEGIGVEIQSRYGHVDVEMKKLRNNPAYLMSGEVNFSSDPSSTNSLIISKGVEIRFAENASLSVYDDAYISAIGTSDEPIIFTGTNHSGPQWNGIHISSGDSRNKLENCEIRYGGANIFEYNGPLTQGDTIQTNIFLGKTWPIGGIPRLILSKCIIGQSGGCGIQVQHGAFLTEVNNTFIENQNGDICEMW